MIANERQYRITKAEVARFERALAQLPQSESKLADVEPAAHPRLRQAEAEALHSQLDDLRAEVAEYELLRSGAPAQFHVRSLEELPQALIQARVVCGLSQKQLAHRLGIKEQQIQRYEATAYASASLRRIAEIMQALQLQIADEMLLRASRR